MIFQRLLAKVVAVVTLVGSCAVFADKGLERPYRFAKLGSRAIHFDASSSVNDKLWGFGVMWDIKRLDFADLILAFEADVYRDSQRRLAFAIGGSVRKEIGPISLGLAPNLMFKENLHEQSPVNKLPFLPVVLPFVQVDYFSRARLRMYYIPPIRSPSDHLVAFQMLFGF